jgi:hypothetical protein
MARYLPDAGVYTCAFLGALVSGYVLANGFGRSGFWGWMIAALRALVSTKLGAIIGGAVLALFVGDVPWHGVFLAVVAIADAAESQWFIMTWILSMIGVDAFARWGQFAPRFQKRFLFPN